MKVKIHKSEPRPPGSVLVSDKHRSELFSLTAKYQTPARSLTVAALIYVLCSPIFAMSSTDEARYTALSKEIRCVVCQNQNIADSNAPLANDLRRKIYTMVEENKSDNDIKDYLVARYGEFILLNPRFNKLTVILWLFPFICAIVAGILIRRYYFNAGELKSPSKSNNSISSSEK